MSDQTAIDLALLVVRCAVGGVMLAHGINHIWGGGKITGTAGWFGSMGMRSAKFQAWMASLTEIGAGALLVIGFLTPLAAAGVVGVMVVAWAINHRGNGFFIFRPGEGWEYVMTLAAIGVGVGTVGPGRWSVDRALELDDDLVGTTGLVLTVGLGVGLALVLLVVFWRPPRPTAETPASEAPEAEAAETPGT